MVSIPSILATRCRPIAKGSSSRRLLTGALTTCTRTPATSSPHGRPGPITSRQGTSFSHLLVRGTVYPDSYIDILLLWLYNRYYSNEKDCAQAGGQLPLRGLGRHGPLFDFHHRLTARCTCALIQSNEWKGQDEIVKLTFKAFKDFIDLHSN